MYGDLVAIYENNRIDMLAMALSYIMDKGWSNVKELTDEEIDSFEGNGLMTKGFVQGLCRLAKEICDASDNPTELYQFCDSVGVYETTYFSNGEHLSRGTLENAIKTLLGYVMDDEEFIMPTSSQEETKEQLADLLDIDIEDLENLLN